MPEKATLHNKTRPLADVIFSEGDITDIGRVYCQDEAFWPVCLWKDHSPEAINRWLKKRRMPDGPEGSCKIRDGLAEVKKEFHLFGNWENNKHQASLSDQYWFKFKNETWETINFFSNRYPLSPGLAFFAPWEASQKEAGEATPDLSTNGVVKKRWVPGDDGVSYLIKGRSLNASKGAGTMPHQDPLCEVLGSMMLDRLSLIKHVRYKFIADGLMLCSQCRNFISQDTEFVPASHIYFIETPMENETFSGHMERMFSRCGLPQPQKFMEKLMVADYIICNYDRHTGNFGAVRDVNTGKFIGYAPIFDYGRCYWDRPDEAVKSRAWAMYKDGQKEAVEKYFGFLDLQKALEVDDMLNLVSTYPYIDDTQCNVIITNILSRQKEMKKAAGK